ncbi:MAG TPA: UvrD-helicase domain-containing protein [Bryobacteraceae bacterium]
MTLSAQQQQAVERTGQDVCVVAGPGSGKTRVLVERFAWLVEKRNVDPGRILAITFTEKAATEMKERLAKRLPERRTEVERAWVSTIDAFCMRVLRENCIAAGLPPDFSVLDPAVAARMEREAAEAALDAMFGEQPDEMRRLLEALDLSTDDGQRKPDLAASLIDVYETMRLAGEHELPAMREAMDVLPEARELVRPILSDAVLTDWHDWLQEFLGLPAEPVSQEHLSVLGRFRCNLHGIRTSKGYLAAREFKKVVYPQLEAQWIQAWYSGLPELLRAAIERIGIEYSRAKRREAATDFADLEEKLIQLLERDEAVRARVQGQFDHMLMDELQDTNRLQWKLVSLVRGTRSVFFAVGDINQSIYAFRHADRTVFSQYRDAVRQSGGVIDELDENHRSRGEILNAVATALDGQPGIEPRTLVAQREPADGPVVERLVGLGDARDAVEASLIARRVVELLEQGYALGHIAILVRTLAPVEIIGKALDQAGIPYLVSGGRTFLEARETLDLMAFLAALVNPLDDIALLAVLRSPLMGWGDEQILRTGPEGWRQDFEKLFGRIRRLAGFVAPDRLIAMALDQCGYAEALPARASANIAKLLGWLRSEHRMRPRPLAELLEELEAQRKGQTQAEAPPPEAAQAVRILTIHAAKGLEFKVVFASAMHKSGDNSTSVILFSADEGLGVKWRHPVTGAGVSDATHDALRERAKEEDKGEENRLRYVAMTRAKDRLVLSYSEPRKRLPWVAQAVAAAPDSTEADRVVTAKLARGDSASATAEVVAAPEPGGQHDSSASVTSVALFANCPRKYYLGRYLGLDAEAVGPGTGALELGTEVHAALAGQVTESEEALGLARQFETGALGMRAAGASHIEREFDFLLPVEDVILRGSIDLWFEEAGELVLVDYKTDRDESRAGEYALQLRLYALALERYAGRIPDRAVLCYLRSGREVEVSITPADLDAAKSSVRTLRLAQDSLDFSLRVGEHCRRCSFYGGLCPAKLEERANLGSSLPGR